MRILFFGRLRDVAPVGPVPADVRDTGALRAWLGGRCPELLDPSIRVVVNDEIIPGDRPLDNDDEVAFLPAMSGG
ncbi:MAG TPA: MoaD/ThiS family protein [Allosphingosinicella sp.]|nr:MoaD/ThiS family protein [Allosphingosinicella sp.]